jgi:exosortase K
VKAKLCVVVVVALLVWSMKRYYADSRPDDLWWILSPTASLVGATTGTAFMMAPGEGFVSHERLFLIEKSCAGINFMIAAFGLLVFARFHRVASTISASAVLAIALVGSYLAAVLVNAARIVIAMWLAAHPVALPIMTRADAHRLEGITVYFGGLVLVYELVQRLDRRIVHAAGSRR